MFSRKLIMRIMLVFILSSVLIACSTQENFPPGENHVSGLISVAKSRGGDVEALYGNSSPDLKTLSQKADLIVIGEAVEQYGFKEVSVITEIRVSRLVKGDAQGDTVKVLQVKDGYELIIGEKYLLVMVSEEPAFNNLYGIRAGIQGVFRQTENGIEVFIDTFIFEIENFIKINRKEEITIDDLANWFETF